VTEGQALNVYPQPHAGLSDLTASKVRNHPTHYRKTLRGYDTNEVQQYHDAMADHMAWMEGRFAAVLEENTRIKTSLREWQTARRSGGQPVANSAAVPSAAVALMEKAQRHIDQMVADAERNWRDQREAARQAFQQAVRDGEQRAEELVRRAEQQAQSYRSVAGPDATVDGEELVMLRSVTLDLLAYLDGQAVGGDLLRAKARQLVGQLAARETVPQIPSDTAGPTGEHAVVGVAVAAAAGAMRGHGIPADGRSNW
jgi:cell division septum initiation protein DivIVA